jgi:hypothetical protein
MWFYSEVPEKYIDHILGMETCSFFSSRNVFVASVNPPAESLFPYPLIPQYLMGLNL